MIPDQAKNKLLLLLTKAMTDYSTIINTDNLQSKMHNVTNKNLESSVQASRITRASKTK